MIPLAAGAGLLALRNGLVDGWTALDTIVMLVGAALAVVNLIIGDRGNPEPLLQLRLFRDPTFSWSMGLSFIIVTALFGGMLLLPLYLQEVHGYSPLETGLLLLPQAITAAVAMPLGGYLTDRIGPRPVVATGMVMLAGGGFLLAQIHPTSSNWLVVSALLLRGFAMGFSMMPSMAAAMARVPHHLSASASSISNSLQRIGSSVGIAVLVTVLAAQFTTAIGQAPCAPSPAVLTPRRHRVIRSRPRSSAARSRGSTRRSSRTAARRRRPPRSHRWSRTSAAPTHPTHSARHSIAPSRSSRS